MKKAFVFGSINMDLVFDVSRLPEKGETMKSKKFIMTPGGKGANQAFALSRQGVETIMLGSVGTDSLSGLSLDDLRRANVSCDYVLVTKDHYCGIAGILVENGENRIITYAGANSVQDIKAHCDVLVRFANHGDYFLTQLEVPLEDVLAMLKKAKSLGLITVLNAAPAKDLGKDVLSLVDILVVNETEMNILTGVYPINSLEIERGCKLLLDKGVKSILLTLGKNGSVYISEDSNIKVDALEVNVVDTTAAGDTYIGVFISKLIVSETIAKAMDYASIGAALAITKIGAQKSIPSKKDIDDFLWKKER